MILENNYLKVTFTPYGASIRSIVVKKVNREVVYGYFDEDKYKTNNEYLGCIVGRNAGRIRNGVIFDREGKLYSLPKNHNNQHTLHGGFGLHNKKFAFEKKENTIIFSYHSLNLENGFFGECDIKITYTLNKNKLILNMEGTTKETAYLNLTNHVSFNFNEDKKSTILNHKLTIDADQFMALDDEFIPYKIVSVEEAFDFRKGKKIGKDIHLNNKQLQIGKGYDHPFILNGTGLRQIASLEGEDVKMHLYSSHPALVVYVGNFMPEGIKLMKGYSTYRGSVALEPQGIPNNQEFEKYKSDYIITNNNPLKETIIWEFESLK